MTHIQHFRHICIGFGQPHRDRHIDSPHLRQAGNAGTRLIHPALRAFLNRILLVEQARTRSEKIGAGRSDRILKFTFG